MSVVEAIPAEVARRPNASYEDSGIEWLGSIPNHWHVKRLKHVCRINPPKSEINSEPRDLMVSFLPMECVGTDGALSLDLKRPLDEVYQGFTYFRDGDVIVAKITPCFENGKGALCRGLENGIGFGTTELHVLRCRVNLVPEFLFYLTNAQPFRVLGTTTMYGAAGQQRVSSDFVENFASGIPPLDEQRAIVGFLDRETAKIDALVAKKERLIALLAEKRTALISHTVTKGLATTAPMKDSGVEWLGIIPAHWSARHMKRIAVISYGVGGELDRGLEEGVPILSLPNVDIDGRLILHDVALAAIPPDEQDAVLLQQGDLLFNWRNGSAAHLGKTA